MKISIAQIKPIKGNIPANIEAHKNFIDLALASNAEAIFFSELSLTGYEPELAIELATNQNDSRLDIFQNISDKDKIIIGLGLPTRIESKIRISMVIFEPKKTRQTYSKQQLHSDELPYFENGVGQVIIEKDNIKIAPAICYESLQLNHSEQARELGAEIYVACVAKPKNAFDKAMIHYPFVAKKFSIPVLMSNCIGYCDNFESVGQSAIWTKQGILVGQLDDKTEGILIFDTETEEVIERTIKNSH